MRRRKTNPDFLTGVPELLVLRLISHRPMHGYAVVQSIKLLSKGELSFGEGSIYPVLHRLEQEKMLKTKEQLVDGRKRVIYSITVAGKKRLSESKGTWEKIVNAVESVLSGDPDETESLAQEN